MKEDILKAQLKKIKIKKGKFPVATIWLLRYLQLEFKNEPNSLPSTTNSLISTLKLLKYKFELKKHFNKESKLGKCQHVMLNVSEYALKKLVKPSVVYVPMDDPIVQDFIARGLNILDSDKCSPTSQGGKPLDSIISASLLYNRITDKQFNYLKSLVNSFEVQHPEFTKEVV